MRSRRFMASVAGVTTAATAAVGLLTMAPVAAEPTRPPTLVIEDRVPWRLPFLERLLASLWAERGCTEGPSTAVLDPGLPKVSVGDTHAVEGQDAALEFSITLSKPAPSPVSVRYCTRGNTAHPITDYTATSGTVVIPAGASRAAVRVPVVDDGVIEFTEDMQLLITAVGGHVVDNAGVGTILDVDFI